MLNFRKSKVVTVWLLSYIAVILLPFTVSLFNYSVFLNNAKKQNASLTDFAVEYTTNNIENIVANIQKIYMDVTTQDELAAVLSVNDPEIYFKNADVQSLLNYFEKMQLYRNEYSGFFLYVPKTECVLSNKGIIDSHTYFDVYYGGTEEDYNRWIATLNTEEKGFFFEEMKSLAANESYIACMSKMPWNIRVHGYDAVFCVVVPRDQFFKKTDKAGWVATAETYIYDNNGENIFNSSGRKDVLPLKELVETIEKGHFL